MRRTLTCLLMLCLLALVGCPSDDPPLESVGGSGGDIAVGPDTAITDTSVTDTGAMADTAQPPAPDGDQPESDAQTDTAPPMELPAPPPDVGAPDCQVDEDCLDILGQLGPCLAPLCEEGSCSADGLPNGTLCSDGDPCTQDDECLAGDCVRVPPPVRDNDPCTDDVCAPESGQCSFLPLSDVPCDDGDLCTGPDVCQGGACTTTPGGVPRL